MTETTKQAMGLVQASVIVGEHCAADDAVWQAWTVLRNYLMNEVVEGYFGNMPNDAHLTPRPVSDEDVDVATKAWKAAATGDAGYFSSWRMRAALEADRAGRGVVPKKISSVDVKHTTKLHAAYYAEGWNACREAMLAQGQGGARDGCEVRLWDTQWMNIVNHDYSDMSKDDAVAYAIKMTEQGIERNIADGKLPPRVAKAPQHGTEGEK